MIQWHIPLFAFQMAFSKATVEERARITTMRYSEEFNQQGISRHLSGAPIAELCRQ